MHRDQHGPLEELQGVSVQEWGEEAGKVVRGQDIHSSP